MTEVYVILGFYRGCVHEVRATLNKDKADEIERKLCGELEVPHEEKEREQYYETADPSHMNEVRHFVVEVER